MRTSSAVAIAAFISNAVATSHLCPLLGPAYPRPANIRSDPIMAAAEKNISAKLNHAIESGKLPVSLSAQIFADSEPHSFYRFSHTDSSLNRTAGVNKVDEDTVFRIGSVSKLWTIYLFMMEKGITYFEEPVIKYVPELASAAQELRSNQTAQEDVIDNVQWDQVTIGELASHIAGIARDYAIGDLESNAAMAEKMGFPALPKSDQLLCKMGNLCTRKQFFAGFLKRHPVVPTASRPVYSNAAFQILAYAMENITGQDYQSLLKNRLIEPLNLARSYYNPPDPKYGAIPGDIASSDWNISAGEQTPGGGLYSSAKDMAAVGRAILNHTLLSPVETRRWMKPRTHSSTMDSSVGAPWEIFSFDESRVVNLYTKVGDLGKYSAILALSPDHGVGFTVLAAGKGGHESVALVSDLISTTLVPALEQCAKAQARKRFTGTYTLKSANSSVTITEDDGPGLNVSSWINNSGNIMDMLKKHYKSSEVSVRLYPTGLESPGRISFRAVMQALPTPDGPGPFSRSCSTWQYVDILLYGNVGVGEFVFGLDNNGNVSSLSPRAMRVTLLKA